MAAPVRQHSVPLVERLSQHISAFEFPAAMRILEALQPTTTPLKQCVRIHSQIYMDFPGAELVALEYNDGLPPRLTIAFLGIAGIHGPLPMPMTEMILRQRPEIRMGLEAFLDIFNHRLAGMVYDTQKTFWAGLAIRPPEETPYGQMLQSLVGLSTPLLQNRLPLPDKSLFPFASLLWNRHKSAAGLKLILENYFNLPTRIQEFCGRWVPIAETQETRIGKTGRFQRLGQESTLGKGVWLAANAFQIQLGPMGWEEYQNFLPTFQEGRGGFETLVSLVSLYTLQKFSVRLSVHAQEIPTRPLQTLRLGWDSWLQTGPLTQADTGCTLYPMPSIPWEHLS